MKLKWLRLEHFRNYESLELELGDGVTALVGLNAQGKTNLLESIVFLALGKSFRAVRTMDTLQWDRPHGRIQARIERAGKKTDLEIFMQREPESKKIRKQSRLTKPKNFLGTLRVVLFTPDQLELISGGPQCRRQFLDRLLLQVAPGFFETHVNYQKILKHRNALLKHIQNHQAAEWELDIWDTRMTTEALKLWEERNKFIIFLKTKMVGDYQLISDTKVKLSLTYKSHEDRFEERLLAHRSGDIQNGSTSVGPHRDDFTLLLDGKDLAQSGSQGEKRSVVLVLKMAELNYLEKNTGEKPLLLLDDVFSELDANRQKKLATLLRDHQCILTTTSLGHLKGLKDAKVYRVKQGQLSPSTD